MKRNKILLPALLLFLLGSCHTAKKGEQAKPEPLENTLLWQISGNGLQHPSYLFGTIHMLCKDDAVLSDSLAAAIKTTDQVYFEVDMDNLFEMIGVLKQMKMRNDTTLSDLLSKADYEKLKKWFETKNSLLPFSVLETYKPLLAASTIMESGMACDDAVAMEQVIMEEAKKNRKKINGLESMSYQMSIFDSIPYKFQAEQLLKLAETDDNKSDSEKEYNEMLQAYKEQNLTKLDEIIRRSDMGIANFENLLLYNRNRNWVKKMKTILPDKSVTVAVGAGHLPGEMGVINLLRKEGYTVKPVKNKGIRQVVI